MNLPRWLGGKDDGARAIEAYNLGLAAKYERRWEESLRQNQLADSLRPGDEATLWNLGIAATALRDWDEARRAWRACGIETNEGPGEVLMPRLMGCVRLNPKGKSEVVWGRRLDPVRMLVENVPLPESNRRCDDIILHDGASEGTRLNGGQEYPVFDELEVWRVSTYSTFEVNLFSPNETAFESLVARCQTEQFGIEDWSTLRNLCEACSRGTPGEHHCTKPSVGEKRYGFAATSEAALRKLLEDWAEVEDGARVGEIRLLLSAAVV
jgi:hypothetical protein